MPSLKKCARCRECKPLDEFPKAPRSADRRHSYCRPCMNDYRREWLAKNPEKREARREGARRRYHANHTENVIGKRIDRRSTGQALIRKRTIEPYKGPSWHEAVDVAPFVAFMRETFPGWTAGEIATLIGEAVPERRLRSMFTGQQSTVELHTVDSFFTRGLGRPDLLNAIYPVEL